MLGLVGVNECVQRLHAPIMLSLTMERFIHPSADIRSAPGRDGPLGHFHHRAVTTPSAAGGELVPNGPPMGAARALVAKLLQPPPSRSVQRNPSVSSCESTPSGKSVQSGDCVPVQPA